MRSAGAGAVGVGLDWAAAPRIGSPDGFLSANAPFFIDARGSLPCLCVCSVQLLPLLTLAQRALSACAAYHSVPAIAPALDQWPGSGQPLAR